MRLIDADAFKKWLLENSINEREEKESRQIGIWIDAFPSAQPERLTDDDFETIRIHLNAYKEKLCNQRRWEEAQEYQRIIDRFMEFASAQPRKKGKWIRNFDGNEWYWFCSNCKEEWYEEDLWMGGNDFPNFCPNCGCQMNGGEQDEKIH